MIGEETGAHMPNIRIVWSLPTHPQIAALRNWILIDEENTAWLGFQNTAHEQLSHTLDTSLKTHIFVVLKLRVNKV